MLAKIVRFTEDTAGLEKLLRLLQGFSTIAGGLAQSSEDVDLWNKTRSQFALGRRYFRFLKWFPCFTNAVRAISLERPTILTAFDVCKWSFLGMYFFLEMLTISNAMGVTAFEWPPKAQREANKCWIYSLLFSILLCLSELFFLQVPSRARPALQMSDNKAVGLIDEKLNGATNRSVEKGKPKEPDTSELGSRTQQSSGRLYTQLAIDCCDLFIPGAAVGWVSVTPVFLGIAITVSTSLAGRQIWNRVQQSAHRG